jgi:type IV fimbrial biogenesis protein FimT
MKKSLGFSLVECMLTLVISTILISVGVPQFQSIDEYFRTDSSIRKVQQTFQLARNHAISYSSRVTVCPIKEGKCSKDWTIGLTIFTDLGESNQIDGTDTIIFNTAPFDSRDFITYNRLAVRFQPTGLASGTNGTLRYCPSTLDNQNSQALIVNQAGRVRFSTKKVITCDN